MNNKIISQLVVAVCLLSIFLAVPLLGACAKPAETLMLKMHVAYPAGDNARNNSIKWWIEEVEKLTASEGHPVDIDDQWLTLAKSKESLGVIRSGMVDMAWGTWTYFPSDLPLTPVGGNQAPFHYSCSMAALKAWEQLYEEFPEFEAEYTAQNMKLLCTISTSPLHIVTARKPIRTMEDLKGLKMRAGVAEHARILESAEAVPVSMSWSEGYDGLAKGVVEGSLAGMGTCNSYKLYEVCKYFNTVQIGAAAAAMGCTVNLDVWDKLPKAVRQVMLEVSEQEAEVWAEMDSAELAELRNFLKEQGMEFIEFDPASLEKWKESPIIKQMTLDWQAEREAKGLPAQKVAARWLELEAEMNASWCQKYPE